MRHEHSPKDASESFRTLDGAYCYFRGWSDIQFMHLRGSVDAIWTTRTLGPEVLHLLDHERHVCLAREEIGRRAARES